MSMRSFLDLAGVSGATYRFQRVDRLDLLPAIAGNFAYVRGDGPEMTVVCCGTAETLMRAGDQWQEAVQTHQAEAIFVRLNVSWKTRGHEHEDIVAMLHPAMVVTAELQ
jgi:hypothetical protein